MRMREAWMPDETAHAGAEHLDPEFVAGYDDKQGRPAAADDVEVLVAHGLDGRSTVVDLGAGTGQFAVPAARQFGRVVAVDVSPAMLEVLRQRAAAAGLANVEFVRAGFLSYEHAGPAADAVHTRNALHQLPDFWKALALWRIAGMLRPGGVLRIHDLVYDCQPSEVREVFSRWFDGAATDPSRGYTRTDFEDHIRTEHSTFRWLFEPMLETAGFEIESAEYSASVYATYTCTRRHTAR
jgi:ubiquinone/menaquinone biosynthesis C-methylase UbiE